MFTSMFSVPSFKIPILYVCINFLCFPWTLLWFLSSYVDILMSPNTWCIGQWKQYIGIMSRRACSLRRPWVTKQSGLVYYIIHQWREEIGLRVCSAGSHWWRSHRLATAPLSICVLEIIVGGAGNNKKSGKRLYHVIVGINDVFKRKHRAQHQRTHQAIHENIRTWIYTVEHRMWL